jgi:hypothetical protein
MVKTTTMHEERLVSIPQEAPKYPKRKGFGFTICPCAIEPNESLFLTLLLLAWNLSTAKNYQLYKRG